MLTIRDGAGVCGDGNDYHQRKKSVRCSDRSILDTRFISIDVIGYKQSILINRGHSDSWSSALTDNHVAQRLNDHGIAAGIV